MAPERANDSCGPPMVSSRPRSAPRWRIVCLLLWAATLAAPLAPAQPFPPKNEFGVWGAYSPNSPDVYTSKGHIQFGVASFRYGRTLVSSPSYAVEYTVDVEPVEIARANVYESCEILRGGVVIPGYCTIGRQWIYGGGVSPFGWKLNLRPARRWQPFGALSGGFVMSRTAIPVDIPKATRFNFTFDLQLGVEHFNAARTRAWTISYKLQHISNGSRSPVNPGVDLNMIAVGYSFFK
jgi:Lipid A 3-O-deacylase (PagL)